MDANTLFQSLGTFWTQQFNDKQTVRGLTIGQAEEAIQQHITLAEALKAYAVADCPVFQLTKWLPIIVKKSEFNSTPFVFEQNGAVFGPQPETDKFYANQIFNWGRAKTPRQNIYVYAPTVSLGSLGVIANRVISPTFACTNGMEVYYNNGKLFFNFNIFENGVFPVAELIGENGEPVTYTSNGEVLQDMFTVLWCYCAEIDTAILYNTYGVLFDTKDVSSEAYKDVLEHLVYIRTDGPTIQNITAVILAFLGEKPIQEQQEIVEDVFDDNYDHIVVTDKNVYKIPLSKTLRDITVGSVLYSGEGISDTVEYYDNLITPNWWNAQIKPTLCIGQNVLLGTYTGQLYFDNMLQPMSVDAEGVLHFPVRGTVSDVAEFHQHIDQQAIIDYFNLTPGLLLLDDEPLLFMDGDPFEFVQPEAGYTLINPVDFLFSNFFKTNSALIKINTILNDDTAFNVFPILSKLLPKHVWLLAVINARQEDDVFTFKSVQKVEDGPFIHADGSGADGVILDTYDYKDIQGKFVQGMSPLDSPDNEAVLVNSVVGAGLRVNGQTQSTVYGANLSTREVRTIAFLTAAV